MLRLSLEDIRIKDRGRTCTLGENPNKEKQKPELYEMVDRRLILTGQSLKSPACAKVRYFAFL